MISTNKSNEHGGHYLMSLYTGKRFHIYEWEELPIGDDVIKRVVTRSRAENSPFTTDGYPMIELLPGLAIDDDENIDNDMEVDDMNEY